jgi:hypothetical protein
MIKYFAKIELNNKVTQVLTMDDSVLKDADGNEHENLGVAFLTELTGWPIWKETWKDGSQRKNFAGIEYTYDETRNAFISPKRYPTWTLNESTCQWDPPTPFPDDGKKYIWNETEQRWDEIG